MKIDGDDKSETERRRFETIFTIVAIAIVIVAVWVSGFDSGRNSCREHQAWLESQLRQPPKIPCDK